MWSLTIWNNIWCFLKFDDLLVGKDGSVVDKLHRVGRITLLSLTFTRFLNNTSVVLHDHTVFTNVTFEECVFHIRQDWCGSNHKTLNGDKLINILWIQFSHTFLVTDVVRPHFVDSRFNFVHLLERFWSFSVLWIIQNNGNETVLNGLIHNRNDFLWI